jgi:ATP-dependent RNA helicase DeaD
MNQQKNKITKVLDLASTDDLTEYRELLKAMKKGLPLFGKTKRIAAALLKEYLGDISRLHFDSDDFKPEVKNLVFEDVKDGKARLFVNIGKSHRIVPGDLIREIVKRSGIDGKLIGKIDIHANYSFIEIPEQYAEIVLLSFDNVRIRGISVVMEPAKKKRSKSY